MRSRSQVTVKCHRRGSDCVLWMVFFFFRLIYPWIDLFITSIIPSFLLLLGNALLGVTVMKAVRHSKDMTSHQNDKMAVTNASREKGKFTRTQSILSLISFYIYFHDYSISLFSGLAFWIKGNVQSLEFTFVFRQTFEVKIHKNTHALQPQCNSITLPVVLGDYHACAVFKVIPKYENIDLEYLVFQKHNHTFLSVAFFQLHRP